MRYVKHKQLGSERATRFGISAAGNVRFLPADDVADHVAMPEPVTVAAQKPHLFGTYTVYKGADVFPFMNRFRR
jgi:hypothetical protein